MDSLDRCVFVTHTRFCCSCPSCTSEHLSFVSVELGYACGPALQSLRAVIGVREFH